MILAVSAALIGAGKGLEDFANGKGIPEGGESLTNKAPTAGEENEKPPVGRRGRPPSTDKAPPVEDDGANDAGRFENNRALIKPLIENSQGDEVKKIIAKYSKTGLKDIPAANQAEFEKDIAALSY